VHTTLATNIVALLAFVILTVLSDVEHCRTARPSAIIQAFFFFTILLDMARVRTQWLLDDNYLNAILVTVIFALRLPGLVIESQEKWRHASIPPEAIAPEDRPGLFGRTFFTWLNPMFMEGYKRDLSMEDLFAIDEDIKGERLYRRLLKQWNSGRSQDDVVTVAK